jgi:uncharacterized protein (DUF934 family)
MLEAPRTIIKGRAIISDAWSVLRLDEDQAADSVAVPEGKVIVPLAVWLAQRPALESRADIGVWIAPDERPEVLKGETGKFAVIGIDFPKFTDGRGYSIAYNLRMRLGFEGELRALGDVLRDQLFAMQRVGFDAYATREDRSIEEALKGLTVFSEVYQTSVDQKSPLFRRHERDVRTESSDVGYGI